MKKVLILSVFTAMALAGCGGITEQADSRANLPPAFVQAKDGTMYLASCLKDEGANIAAGVEGAGESCKADNLNETQVRGLRGLYGNSAYYYYVSPVTYYGGSNTTGFCQQYFGLSWNGCYSWLGYGSNYYNSNYYQPSCSSCVNVSITYSYNNTPYTSYPNPSYCSSSCTYSKPWAAQSWYQQWNSFNWWYTW